MGFPLFSRASEQSRPPLQWTMSRALETKHHSSIVPTTVKMTVVPMREQESSVRIVMLSMHLLAVGALGAVAVEVVEEGGKADLALAMSLSVEEVHQSVQAHKRHQDSATPRYVLWMPPGLSGARGVAAAELAVEGGKAGPGVAIRPNMAEAHPCVQTRKQHLETAIPMDAQLTRLGIAGAPGAVAVRAVICQETVMGRKAEQGNAIRHNTVEVPPPVQDRRQKREAATRTIVPSTCCCGCGWLVESLSKF